jgi:hypothetical protein
MVRTWLQHALHPLNVWCRIGGRATKMCRFYERLIWQPCLRRLFGGAQKSTIEN